MIMKRTTIMLPTDLKAKAIQRARKLNLSLGELIRESLRKCITKPSFVASDDPFYMDKAVFEGTSPYDLSEKHDDYLYGEKDL